MWQLLNLRIFSHNFFLGLKTRTKTHPSLYFATMLRHGFTALARRHTLTATVRRAPPWAAHVAHMTTPWRGLTSSAPGVGTCGPAARGCTRVVTHHLPHTISGARYIRVHRTHCTALPPLARRGHHSTRPPPPPPKPHRGVRSAPASSPWLAVCRASNSQVRALAPGSSVRRSPRYAPRLTTHGAIEN